MNVVNAKTNHDYEIAKSLFMEYQKWLGVDLCFQGFKAELSSLPEMYGPPNGAMILIQDENGTFGCVGLRRLTSECCEMKRMYVIPSFQNKGAGKILLKRFVELAKEMNFKRVRLDTLGRLKAAVHLYQKFGFYEIQPYCCNPDPEAKFYELNLE